MGKTWDSIKKILSTNLTKNLKNLITKFGKFLIAILQLSIPVMLWITQTNINEPVLATFVFASYVAFAELSSSAIIDIFKNNNEE